MKINGHTRMAAVVAKPIKHSISPLIHNMAFEKTGVNGVYLAWEVEAKDLQASIENIRRYDMFGRTGCQFPPYRSSQYRCE